VWLEDWQLQGAGDSSEESWELRIQTDRFAFDFELQPLTPIVPQGNNGLSQKSAEWGNASFYYSIPRLRTTGAIRLGDQEHQVSGLSWLDREWSTSALGDDQVGWDWFALQLDDGRDLMYYQLRRTDGQPDAHSAGVLVGSDGTRRRLGPADVELEPRRWWRSADGVRYPIAWRLQLFDGSGFRVEAVFDDQRMDTTVQYWEGMVDVFDAKTVERAGRGYLELAGYE
jgi:predicted secreted hydrolase